MDEEQLTEQAYNASHVYPQHHRTRMVVVMTSTLFTVVCIGLILLLIFVLLALLYTYYARVRKRYTYDTKTVRYSPVAASEVKTLLPPESEGTPTGSGRGRRKKTGANGHHYHAPHYYAPSHWPAVPVTPHIDISAGHLLLAYIESNLQNRNQLKQEWENLQSYVPEVGLSFEALKAVNKPKNRYPDVLPYDHARVKLSLENNQTGSDYINASFIIDTNPTHPSYITTQGPLHSTIADFWQMVWEQNVSVVVMLTTLIDIGLTQSVQYWPTSGVATYHIYEVRLVSEHPHSEDYTIRSFYLQNTKTHESRTVTQFHYTSWSAIGAPPIATPLLEFRRKVNKAHGRLDPPLLVHCSEGSGRSGSYILMDMSLNRIQTGAKELNLAATVEHLRDQRPHMVRTKAQFEFALSALVEETHAMLDAAAQRHRP